ncbi:hypothetical protein [Qipengyuania sediminis]|uniref:hypothetical protein n=1 Tax=Qipengyuania sediminis TaxID=1532023 RepID=UPI00105AA308|nr:hypothetical protein [Qipengyuania sediminis]
MSFSDKPGLTASQKLGCAVYFFTSALVVTFFMLNAALGDCASEEQAECMGEATRAAMFYGSPLLALIGGALLIRHMMRDRD